MKKRKNIIVVLLSILLSIFLIVGNSFKKKGSFEFITNHLIIHTVTFLILATYEMISCIENSFEGILKNITKIVRLSYLLIICFSLLLVAFEVSEHFGEHHYLK